jgi:translocation and assembly module TamB
VPVRKRNVIPFYQAANDQPDNNRCMDQPKKKKRFLNRPARIALKTVLYLFIFLVLLVILIQTPLVQNFLRKKAVAWLENKIHTKVTVGSIYAGLPDKIILKNVYIEDRHKDTLLAGGSLKANINLFRLIFHGAMDFKKVELENITLKASRQLPDTTFNYQFFVNAFSTKDTTAGNPKDTTEFFIGIPSVELNNIRLIYNDIITGSDIELWINHMNTRIDKFDPVNFVIDVPHTNLDGMTAKFYQTKPLVTPDSLSKDIAQAQQPISMQLDFKEVNLKNIRLDYRNDVSALYTSLDLGTLKITPAKLDLPNRIIALNDLSLSNTKTAIRLGKKESAKIVKKETKQEIKSLATADWHIQVASLNLDNNDLSFDDDNIPKTKSGMDYAHLKADSLSLQVNDLLLSTDSVAGKISKGEFKEQSGFILEQLQTDFLYANNQAYFKDLFLKTPGSEIKRYVLLNYSSYNALADSFDRTQIDADIANSHVQVKDVLAFAPQLSNQPAFANPEATWYLNFQGDGNMQSLHIRDLQFRGLKNTQINAKGTLASAADRNRSSGTLQIQKLHTTQADIALLTGSRLSNDQINLPEEIDVNGTLAGSINNLSANLNFYSTAGAATIHGQFTDLTNINTATYTALVRANSLNIGSILRNDQLGRISANVSIAGKGFTENAAVKFKGSIYVVGFNDYEYRNIELNGSIQQSTFAVFADVNDPNIDLNGNATGKFSAYTSSFHFQGSVDSIKMLPLHLTPEPLVFRGKINADFPAITADQLDGNILITKALFVSGPNRLPLDTIQFVSGKNDSVQFMTLKSDVAMARLSGHYRYSDLGEIFQNSIQPYFNVTSNTTSHVKPYHLTFIADIVNSPVLAVFVPGLKSFEPIHTEGSIASGQGLTGTLTTAYIFYQGNEISGLTLKVNTTDKGLQFTGDVQRLKGANLDVYHTRLSGIAVNNKLDFNLNVDDSRGKDKYYLSGILTQPYPGNYTLNLRPDSLLLNYERWTISPGNSLTITKDNILANNFSLQKGDQQLNLQSVSQQLNVRFTNFQLGTITGFMKSDTILVNGSMNGTIVFKNLMKQPVFTSDLIINDLSFRGDTLGNAIIKVNNTSGDRYNTNVSITGRGNDIAITGSFAPQGNNDIALDLNLAIRQMQLHTMEGALAGFIKNASGSVNGNISINGTLNQPKINGPLNFDKTSFAVSILGSQFRIDQEKLTVTENGLRFDDFVIRDTANNMMKLNGTLNTSNFINYNFNLDVTADNFKILNTTKKESKIYYGALVITSQLHVSGTEVKPVVDGKITVDKGTNFSFVVPQREPGVVEREGIVEFVDADAGINDSLFRQYDSLDVFSITGMNITTNIEIKKEAIFNIIIDEANGDFINIQGEAQLSTGIDPSGKITLVGNYELEKGSYEITFNFLHRRFDIQKGSKIVWLNEPTRANLDVSATYIANTSPIDLVQNQIASSTMAIRNTYLQKLPFEVRLHLTGELLQPKVDFDIVLPGNKSYGVSNDIITQVDTRLEQLRQDPGEINKQVFSLLLLNRFVGQNPLQSTTPFFDASSYARQSVSKLLTGELNQLAAGLIDGVDLTFDVTSTDDYTTGSRRNRTDLNIGASKRLLNERLTVAVGSNFEVEGAKNSSQKASNVIGNLSVNYAISRDGRYMIRFYRKNEYEGIVDGYIIESGLSFIITVDYNRLRDLVRRKKVRVEDGKR